jgi:arylsulfatase A-like enzyme
MVTKVDTLLGRLFAALDRERLWADTVVLFTSDHGDFAGQYGLIEKWDTAMADCILRTPCVLCAPGLPAGRVDSLTEHTDLCPTLLELLDIAPDWGIHGESLLPVIRGERRKAAVFADGGHEDEMLGRFSFAGKIGGKQRTYRDNPDTMARTKMARTERWKLVMRVRGGNELYDLAADPWELNNLWGRPELLPVVAELQQQMIEWCLRTDTDRPYQAQVGA